MEVMCPHCKRKFGAEELPKCPWCNELNAKVSITGTIKMKESDSSKCICCPGNHIYSVHVDWDEPVKKPIGWNKLEETMYRFIEKNKPELRDKRVKVTIELEPDQPKSNS